jgi:anti-sigma regulatory factor (Ser/Thr protein kinase)
MPHPLALELPPTPVAGATARRALEQHFAGRLADAALVDVKIIVSALVNHAVRHGAGEVTVTVDGDHAELRIEVRDAGRLAAHALRAPRGNAGGWGLRMIDAIAHRWGVATDASAWVDLVPRAALSGPSPAA